MIPKVFYVGVIVAVSQLTGVFTSSFLSLSNNHEILAIWANAESIIIAITSLLFFGHQHSLNRDLIECNSLNKKTELIRNTQNIIFSMSIFFFIFFILFFFFYH